MKDNRFGVVTLQWPRCLICLASIFKLTQTYSITPLMLRHGNPYDNAMVKTSFLFSKQNASTDTTRLFSQKPMRLLTVISNFTIWAHLAKDWRGATCATPLLLNLYIPTSIDVFCDIHIILAVQFTRNFSSSLIIDTFSIHICSIRFLKSWQGSSHHHSA